MEVFLVLGEDSTGKGDVTDLNTPIRAEQHLKESFLPSPPCVANLSAARDELEF